MKWISIYHLDFVLTIIIHQMKINFLLISLIRKLWKKVFLQLSRVEYRRSTTLSGNQEKRTLDQNQKKLNKNRRESQWLTETTDGTLKTAPHTLQLISDNEQKNVGEIWEKFMIREDREIIERYYRILCDSQATDRKCRNEPESFKTAFY